MLHLRPGPVLLQIDFDGTYKGSVLDRSQPILPVDVLILVVDRHIDKMVDRRVVYQRAFVPPIQLFALASRVDLLWLKRVNDDADEFGITTSFAGNGGEATSVLVIRLDGAWVGVEVKQVEHRYGSVVFDVVVEVFCQPEKSGRQAEILTVIAGRCALVGR